MQFVLQSDPYISEKHAIQYLRHHELQTIVNYYRLKIMMAKVLNLFACHL